MGNEVGENEIKEEPEMVSGIKFRMLKEMTISLGNLPKDVKEKIKSFYVGEKFFKLSRN